MRVLATQQPAGARVDELPDVEIGPLTHDATMSRQSWRPVRIDNAVLDLFPALRLVANYGVGYDPVDVPARAARAASRTNTPGVLDAATADSPSRPTAARRRPPRARTLSGAGGTSWSHAPFRPRGAPDARASLASAASATRWRQRARGLTYACFYDQRIPLDEVGSSTSARRPDASRHVPSTRRR